MKSEQDKYGPFIRTIIAIVFVLAFVGVFEFSSPAELFSAVLRLFNSAREANAKPVNLESRTFDVRNSTDVSESMLRGAIRLMESDYDAITTFLGKPGGRRIPVVFVAGQEMAVYDGDKLVISVDKGAISTETVPFMLVLAAEDWTLQMDASFLYTAGYAVYVLEEAKLADTMMGQSTDAWVTLLRQKNALLGLEDISQRIKPGEIESPEIYLWAIIEGASFMRWVAEAYGLPAARAVVVGDSPQAVTGMSLTECEARWLASVEARKLDPRPCRLALSSSSMFNFVCRKLDESH